MTGNIGKKACRAVLFSASAAFILAGCSGGGDTGNHTDNPSDGTFVATPETVGTFVLQVNNANPNVGEVVGFFAGAKNTRGEGVQGIEIYCDSEKGVALIEPTTGHEMTDSIGAISGKFGCETPGSYQLMCRMATGAFLRKAVTIRCSGPIPADFTGFPDAGGGTLGGGGGSKDGTTAINSITFDDGTITGTQSIDIQQNPNCGTDLANPTPEAFGDTMVHITITNSSASTITVPSYTFSVGSSFQSSVIALGGESMTVAPGASATFTSVFAYQNNTAKYFSGEDAPISVSGVQNVEIAVQVISADGNTYELLGEVALKFANIDRCA